MDKRDVEIVLKHYNEEMGRGSKTSRPSRIEVLLESILRKALETESFPVLATIVSDHGHSSDHLKAQIEKELHDIKEDLQNVVNAIPDTYPEKEVIQSTRFRPRGWYPGAI
jgi:hypothetical protein